MSPPHFSGFVAHNVSKHFGATQALDDVTFAVDNGEIHALVGENGAGKSTLVKIMSGYLQANDGHLEMDGQRLDDLSPKSALDQGIVVVHQELSLMPNLSVAENILINDPPIFGNAFARAVGHVDRRKMTSHARSALALLGANIDPSTMVSSLSQAQRQLVEIIRALAHSARLILLDEPTSSLPPDERSELFNRIALVRNSGVGIVFITHLLDEALSVSDRITVLRDGKNVGTRPAAETSVLQLVELMTGRPPGSVFPVRGTTGRSDRPKLVVDAIVSRPKVHSASFDIRQSEIVGLAGLVGSGRTECLKAIFGALPLHGGTISIDGQAVSFRTPGEAIRSGVAFIPEDRQEESIFSNHPVLENICVAAASSARSEKMTRIGNFVLNRREMAAVAEQLRERLQVKSRSIWSPITSLSGGNQQKTVLARWMAAKPSVVLADEPTRGVSIGSKIEIYRLIRRLAAEGAAILIVSSEFEELLGLCDRIVVMHDGRTVDELRPEGLEADDLLQIVLSKAASDASGAGQSGTRTA